MFAGRLPWTDGVENTTIRPPLRRPASIYSAAPPQGGIQPTHGTPEAFTGEAAHKKARIERHGLFAGMR